MADLPTSTEELRALFKKGDDARDAGLPTNIPEVERIDNLSYGPDKKWNLLDIYLPKNRTGKVPTIISIHGGGWVYGTKETYQFYGMSLAKMGFGFVNFNYHLGPDVVFPGILDDVQMLMEWVEHNVEKYHLDLKNIFLLGDSAGGQMTEQYLAIATNDDFRKLFGYKPLNFKFNAAALNCGAYFMLDKGQTQGAVAAYFAPDAIKDKKELLNTEQYLTKKLPPLFIMTANEDFLHDNAVRLDGFLRAKGIEHELHIYGTPDNPKQHVFHCNVRDEVGQQCNKDETDFFKRYIVK